MRKLVTIRKVGQIEAIEGADRIVLTNVDGWQCVTKKEEFEEGDYALFFEIDSFVPADDSRFDFVTAKTKRTYLGKEGGRIKTQKLRGVVSQGLAIPLSTFPEVQEYVEKELSGDYDIAVDEVVDFADMLNVFKYDTEVAQGSRVTNSDQAGEFPWYIPKTDQERLQNIYNKAKENHRDTTFAATLKVDGSSATYAYLTDERFKYEKYDTDEDNGQFIVCSRNRALKTEVDEETQLSNIWVQGADNVALKEKLKNFHLETGRSIAVQSELLGPGIQGNRESFTKYTLLAYAIYDIDKGEYLSHNDFMVLAEHLGIATVPVVKVTKAFEEFETIKDFVEFSNNLESYYAKVPEGVVFHSIDSDQHFSFKVISPKFLLKNDE